MDFGGLAWFPKLDVFSLRIPSLYFGTKKRGKIPTSVKVFDGSCSIDQFTPEQITRRQCTGIVAQVWDILGKVAPITLKLRHDLRKLIITNSDWDAPLSKELRAYWIQNFQLIEDIKEAKNSMKSIDKIEESKANEYAEGEESESKEAKKSKRFIDKTEEVKARNRVSLDKIEDPEAKYLEDNKKKKES